MKLKELINELQQLNQEQDVLFKVVDNKNNWSADFSKIKVMSLQDYNVLAKQLGCQWNNHVDYVPIIYDPADKDGSIIFDFYFDNPEA